MVFPILSQRKEACMEIAKYKNKGPLLYFVIIKYTCQIHNNIIITLNKDNPSTSATQFVDLIRNPKKTHRHLFTNILL